VGFGPELEGDGLEHAQTKKAIAVAAMAAPKRTLLKTMPWPGGYTSAAPELRFRPSASAG
jgi:hypothetical protein